MNDHRGFINLNNNMISTIKWSDVFERPKCFQIFKIEYFDSYIYSETCRFFF